MRPAKYTTGQEAVDRLRHMATLAALDVIRPLMLKNRAWKAKKPINQSRFIARLDTICTCIDVLTEDGNYAAEREEAITRARGIQ